MTGKGLLRRGNWSVQELARLRQLLPMRGVAWTASLLRRSPRSVEKKALELLRVPARHGDWTDSDDMQLRQAWGAVEVPILGPILGRTAKEVRARANELRGKHRGVAWSRAELGLLKKLYGTRRDEDLEVSLMRDREEVATAAQRLCLAKDKRFRASSAGARACGAAAASSSVGEPGGSAEVLRELATGATPDVGDAADIGDVGSVADVADASALASTGPKSSSASPLHYLAPGRPARVASRGGPGSSPGAVEARSSMPRWTSEEVQRLRELYPHRDNLAVARELGRTVTSVANKAYQLKIRKSANVLADIGRANIAMRYQRDDCTDSV
ncbi:MAG: SANT/Myb-like DNA-binding domain-containing protein [Planctomycetota bacterium]